MGRGMGENTVETINTEGFLKRLLETYYPNSSLKYIHI